MSFPALLRIGANPTFHEQRVDDSYLTRERMRRAKINLRREGKQWVRRRENTQFTSNPHITAPSAHDMALPIPGHRPAFPQPLPSYLKRNMEAPHWQPPVSKASGRPSLRGMRKMLRGNGVHAEKLVQAFETEILSWLHNPMLNPDLKQQDPGRLIGPGGKVREISQTHGELVWYILEDAFARYILHCLAKFHCLVSFSKETPNGERFTHILRPRAQAIRTGITSPNTPPFTDLDSASVSDFTGGTPDLLSEASDAELDPVAEESEGDWVHVGDGQVAGSMMIREEESLMASLTLDNSTPRPMGRRPLERPSQLLRPHLRSGSPPSPTPRQRRRNGPASPFTSLRGQSLQVPPQLTTRTASSTPQTFYDYIWG
ncbi:hypothetical protein FRB95_007699 [Tulasnella sp. JGI-2019a]|nr:hypothetical protein FRB95_007699 [Tulasnella sp. JGI-2019a]